MASVLPTHTNDFIGSDALSELGAHAAIGFNAADSRDRTSSAFAGETSNTMIQSDVDAWSEEELEEDSFWAGSETTALVGSMLVHLIAILALALVPLSNVQDPEAVVIVSTPPDYTQDRVELIDEVTYSDVPQEAVGANSVAQFEMAAASAEQFAEIAEIPNPIEMESTDFGDIMVNKMFTQAVAPLDRLENQKGKVGEGTLGAAGAVDRITFEIIKSLEERPTLVVWLFDQSGSLHRQRTEIRDRFDRIYSELGIVERSGGKAFRKNNNDIPLLTSVIGFGSDVKLYTEEPTEDVNEVKSIVDNIQIDTSGTERVFTAVESAVEQYKGLRRRVAGNDPLRNVLLVVVTDERGDDADHLESAIGSCRKWGIPVYVIGVPAPFGQEHSLVKYVDPDPKYDQTPQWAEVDQGPETFLPERVQVGFTGDFKQEAVIDSGFGPYALTRMCYETGGIYFTVHPNRDVSRKVNRGDIDPFAAGFEYFFDPNAMARYRPDYLSPQDYVQKVKASPLRQSLVTAAQMRPASVLQKPRTRFVKVDEARLAGDLTTAQQEAAVLEPMLVRLAEILNPGMPAREQEESPRWKAGFDLAMGRVLAQKVRTETYNAMLAKAKRGMVFEKPKNNTWVLEASDEISVGSKWESEADTARNLLKGVVQEHEGTPWALMAKQELAAPIGWVWKEEFTDPNPPAAMGAGNNNNNPPPKDDQKKMLNQAPKRPLPKL